MLSYGPLLIVGLALLAVVATVLVGCRVRVWSDGRTPTSPGLIGAILSGLFVVLLGLYTVSASENTRIVSGHIVTEAQRLVDVYEVLGSAPQPQRHKIRGLVREYTAQVANHEWSMLGEGRFDPEADRLLNAIRTQVADLPAWPDQVTSARADSLLLLADVANDRNIRVTQEDGGHRMTSLLFLAAVVVAALLLFFPLLFALEAGVGNIVATAIVGFGMVLACYAAFEIAHPFQGWLRVGPDAFQNALHEFSEIP